MNSIRHRFVLGICVLCTLSVITFPMPCDSAEKKIILVGTQDTKDSYVGIWLDMIYTEVFRRIGYQLEYEGYPAARAVAMSDRGEVDGDIHRGYGYNNEGHPNLIRVEEPHFSVAFTAYAVKPGIRLEGWDSLRNTDYKVEYRRGIVKIGNMLSQIIKESNLSDITTVQQGLKKLILGRTDIYIDVDKNVIEAIRKLDPVKFNPSAVYEAGIMETMTSHAFLHKKNADIVPKIDETLKLMKQEGLIEKYKIIALEKR